MTKRQPRMIPNPLWCETCEGRGYVMYHSEWEPYTVQCPRCGGQQRRATDGGRSQPFTAADLATGERIVRELHGLKGFDAWAERIAKALAAERERRGA